MVHLSYSIIWDFMFKRKCKGNNRVLYTRLRLPHTVGQGYKGKWNKWVDHAFKIFWTNKKLARLSLGVNKCLFNGISPPVSTVLSYHLSSVFACLLKPRETFCFCLSRFEPGVPIHLHCPDHRCMGDFFLDFLPFFFVKLIKIASFKSFLFEN